MEEVLDAKEIESIMSDLEASPKGIEGLLSSLGYTLLPEDVFHEGASL